ncbi:ABC transporter ATP-binding protein, partial [Nocardiopsis tropica]|nr:ABC transporter ATP-binding protein [Nocardiopsis tropica]
MRVLPQPPGIPDHRSANRFLLWLARAEWRPLAWAGGVDSAYRLCGVLMSAAVGATLDSGVVEGDPRSLLLWFGVLTGLTLLSTALVPVGVRAMAFNWYSSAYRTVQVVIARSVALGPTLTRRLPSGEVVAVGTDDIDRVGDFYEDSALVPASVVTIG